MAGAEPRIETIELPSGRQEGFRNEEEEGDEMEEVGDEEEAEGRETDRD